jgi:hypothetical protein
MWWHHNRLQWEKALDERKLQSVLSQESDVEVEEPEEVLA